MSHLVITNILVKRNKINGRIIDIKKLKENILDYNVWLQKTHREDRIQNYEEFLRAAQ